MDKHLWIIGCGDIGHRVADLYFKQASENASYQQQPLKINALVCTEVSKHACEQKGITATAVDLDQQNIEMISELSGSMHNTALFYFAPPPSSGRKDTRLQFFLSALKQYPKRIVLISTTGVYGDSKGCWIDETFPVNPSVDRAHRRLSAENYLKEWAIQHQCEYLILRVAGIYAKDRLPLARLKKGLPVVKSEQAGWTNRIHADDLANVCKQAMASSISGEIYNVTDSEPSTMTHYFNQLADYAGLARPPQISMQEAEQTLSSGMLSYLRESRRISNQKMLDQLDISLSYPSLKEGLKHVREPEKE
ncbi:MAG: NAD-dependent epimerase/dehydratase family protein [Cocleimonas sp.]|nr:NAD-dependent epimerase/dehydratase family protein [Cocleimonas sp.]